MHPYQHIRQSNGVVGCAQRTNQCASNACLSVKGYGMREETILCGELLLCMHDCPRRGMMHANLMKERQRGGRTS